MSAAVTTMAHTIITVDHTGYTGPVTVGAITTPPVNGESQHFQSTGVLKTPGTIHYEADFPLEEGTSYIFYAVAEGSLELAGGSLPITMSGSTMDIHVIVYGQPQIPSNLTTRNN